MMYGRLVSVLGMLLSGVFACLPLEADPRLDTTGFKTAPDETTYFGGTTWNAARGRWEAMRDSVWTFDSGVGSHFNHDAPGVMPHKDPSLHAYMEGWVGVDKTYPDPLIQWRRVSRLDPRWESHPCVGRVAGFGGQWSVWLGAFQSEADSLCYITGRGYGNDWLVPLAKRFYYPGTGSLQLTYDYVTDISQDDNYWDDLYIQIQRPDPDPQFPNGRTYELWHHFGQARAGRNTLNVPAYMLPATPDSFTIAFTFMSFRSWPDYPGGSDEDGFYDSQCSLALDNITLSGVISETTDFESGNNGWGFLAMPAPLYSGNIQFGGEWSDIADLATLPPMQIPCALRDSVLIFDDHTPGRPSKVQDNYVLSPWIDLERDNATGAAHYFVECDAYYYLPTSVHTFVQAGVQWEPDDCVLGAASGPSPVIMDVPPVYIAPKCFTPLRLDITNLIPSQAKSVRIALGLLSNCYQYSECNEYLDPDARFDNVRLGVVRSVTGVSEDHGITPTARLFISPNPVRSGRSSRLTLTGITDKTATVHLLNIAGRRVRSWNMAVGEEESWDAVDASGHPLPSGVFYLRWNAGVSHGTTKVLVLSP